MKAVLDTGIFISALISSQGLPYQAVDLWIDKRFDLVTSTWQIQELREVSRYPRIAPGVTLSNAAMKKPDTASAKSRDSVRMFPLICSTMSFAKF